MFHIQIQHLYWAPYISEWLKVYSFVQDVLSFMIQNNELYGGNI